MEKNLTIKEEKKARNLKTKFTDVHAQIQGVQIEIEMMNKRAESLIKNLNELRDEEVEFVKQDDTSAVTDRQSANYQALYHDSEAPPIVKLVTMIIADAVNMGASDKIGRAHV